MWQYILILLNEIQFVRRSVYKRFAVQGLTQTALHAFVLSTDDPDETMPTDCLHIVCLATVFWHMFHL
jgi:hypothetical protein